MTGIISDNVGRTSGLIKAVAGGGAWTLIKSQTASSSATISFVDGTSDVVLDNTYPIYLFQFINIHPQTDGADFTFNFSTDGGSNYNVTKTSTIFQAYQGEGGLNPTLNYDSSRDLAQSTAFQVIMQDPGNDNDQSGSGIFYLFNPSDSTFVKHFISQTNELQGADYTVEKFLAGYGNTTSAIDAVQFKFASGNIDDGKIKLVGLKDS